MENNWRFKSLENLEKDIWPASTEVDSSLIKRVNELRRTPLNEFQVEDLRIMIGQNIGLLYLIPLALEQLRKNPLAEGHFYPGDLLQSVLKVEEEFWSLSPELKKQLLDIIRGNKEALNAAQIKLGKFKDTKN